MNTGEDFRFDGDWLFQPSSSSQRVRVPDAHYMWFGWWSQQPLTNPAIAIPANFKYRRASRRRDASG